GVTFEAQTRFDEAIEQYRKAAELWKMARSLDQKIALCNWADALYSKKLYEEAAEKCREAIAIDPSFAPAYDGLGLTFEAQERFDEAIEEYRKAGELWRAAGSSDQKIALRNWADALGSKKLHDEAAEKYREAIAIDPDFAPAHNGLGLTLAAQERLDEAIEQ